MNINHLITFIALLLGGVYVFFNPLAIATDSKNKQRPLIELQNYTMYEFDTTKLADFSIGKKALRYKEKYVLFDFIYNENLGKKIVSLSAHKGTYKNDTVRLNKNVRYVSSEGVEFTTEKALYDRKKEYARCDTPFTAKLNDNIVTGSTLYYDIRHEKFKSKNVRVLYSIDGKKR